jgi:hypothetical protein
MNKYVRLRIKVISSYLAIKNVFFIWVIPEKLFVWFWVCGISHPNEHAGRIEAFRGGKLGKLAIKLEWPGPLEWQSSGRNARKVLLLADYESRWL